MTHESNPHARSGRLSRFLWIGALPFGLALTSVALQFAVRTFEEREASPQFRGIAPPQPVAPATDNQAQVSVIDLSRTNADDSYIFSLHLSEFKSTLYTLNLRGTQVTDETLKH